MQGPGFCPPIFKPGQIDGTQDNQIVIKRDHR
jgi:uncharacterized phosphosugar-binding protein